MEAALVPTGVLLLDGEDRPGLVAGVAEALAGYGANIVDAQQHVTRHDRRFYQRIEFELDGLELPRDGIGPALGAVTERLGLNLRLRFRDEVAKVALLCSRELHCVEDLLNRWRRGDLVMDPVGVFSNHDAAGAVAAFSGVPFHHLPVVDDPGGQEDRLAGLVDAAGADLVVLARYMRILSPELCARWAGRSINIHHSFLPAFVGADPYRRAHARGVKIIGATAHYVTDELDAGPIITQGVTPVSHRDEVDDFVRRGRDLEVAVLATAVRAHLEHRVLIHDNRTVVFD
jgi:formyltetrahydrofolate deformylase